MKSAIILVLIWGLGLSARCQQTKFKEDSETLKQVLFNYFDGIKTRDSRKMTDVTTTDFFLYEEGKVWTNDSVFQEMKRFPYTSVEFKFDNFKIDIDNTLGHMAYFEQANFVLNDTTHVNLSFLGSAVFRKVGKTWKMSFLHSDKRYVRKKK